ncbi:MAG TPA: hypothetical protein VEG38_15785 [Acidimicrobiia bacterium]|nr:hypothetical protein [Acidimicrobiia bacterium]
MATQRTSFTKLQRDRAKKAKAAAKREKRLERAAEARTASDEVDETAVTGEGPISAAELLHEIEVTHQRYEAKLMTYEEFEEKKAELLSRLPIE